MKRILSLLLIAIFIFTLSACGNKNKNKIEEKSTTAEHIHEYIQDIMDATCTQEGKITYKCESCGDTYSDVIAAKGHQYNGATCTNCNYTDQEKAIEELKSRVQIDGVRIHMDSAGGVDVYIAWKNKSEQEIKYMGFAVQLYNRVGDVVSCEIRNTTKSYLKQTGPIPIGKGMYNCWSTSLNGCTAYFVGDVSYDVYKLDEQNGWEGIHWDNVWYNTTARYAKVVGVDIEYMDGTNYKLEDEAIFNALGIRTPDIDTNAWDY